MFVSARKQIALPRGQRWFQLQVLVETPRATSAGKPPSCRPAHRDKSSVLTGEQAGHIRASAWLWQAQSCPQMWSAP